ncbi:putative 2OG-Fe(II) oxygenase [Sphingomonas sp.]|uniref:putative 2OG-Fe(II) oxygenase n=1 Tax=Sphingomonas sp. TaxID=28214 RepID=UPI003D6CBC58
MTSWSGGPFAGDLNALAQHALQALDDGNEAESLPTLAAAAERVRDNALLWQCTGLLYRALDRHNEAVLAFDRAARLAPADAKIAEGRAQIALEAGFDAVALFDRARALNPGNGGVHLGMAAARFAAGDSARAIAELDSLLGSSPGWVEGHANLARLRTMMGERDIAMVSFERALADHPRNMALWKSLVLTLSEGEQHTAVLDVIRRGRAQLGDIPFFDTNEAIALSEAGDVVRADALFARASLGEEEEVFAVHRVRHLLRTGRVGQALPLIDRWTARPDAVLIWPNAAIAWRMVDDPRWQWLEGDERLVSVIDLGDRLPDLDQLAAALRGLHLARAQPLDQSVRGGTQTDGHLLRRCDPAIQALRAALIDAVEAHIARLPPIDPAHPTLRHRRDRAVRFSGAWSVRLAGAGHHANHVHPAGWLSSALYVALPDEAGRGGGDAGWLALGQPQEALGLDLLPQRMVEPRPGRLVLFPSWMWHGTRRFAKGERLTVAFDVAPPH